MITLSQTQTLAGSFQIDTFTIMREYLQLVFLNYLYASPESKHIYFKGGTAIRLLFGSPRFSEDLDFSTTLSCQRLQSIILDLAGKLQSELPGLQIKLLYSGKTSIRYHLKYSPQDFKYPLNLRLDFTFVQKVLAPAVSPLVTRFPLTVFPLISHLSSAEILAEKLCALSSRTKGRDYYDTWYLLEKGIKLDPKLLSQKFHENKLIFNQQKLLSRVHAYSQKDLNLDLAQFLPKSQKPIIKILLDLLVAKIAGLTLP